MVLGSKNRKTKTARGEIYPLAVFLWFDKQNFVVKY
jgi:hypothetical protein